MDNGGITSFWRKRFADARLRERVISSLVLGPLVLLAVYAGGWIYALAVLLSMGLCMREWLALVARDARWPLKAVAHAVLVLMLAAGAGKDVVLPDSSALAMALFSAMLLVPLILAGFADRERFFWVALGVPYLAGGGLALMLIRDLPDIGVFLAFYLFLTVWSTDIGAFLAGRLIGGPKLLPSISPKKTWAGLGGGMALAGTVGYLAALGFGSSRPCNAALLAVGLAIVAQSGDFFESWVKRRFGVKDSGGLIPGHGGLLDRVDGLLFAGVFLAFVLFFDPERALWF